MTDTPTPTCKPKIRLGFHKDPEPEKDDQFKTLDKLNGYIKEVVENNVFFMFLELLKKIGDDYQISESELKDKYMAYFKKDLKNSNLYSDFLSLNLKNTAAPTPCVMPMVEALKSTEINPNKCYARTAASLQCSRKRQKDSDFCGSHAHSQPYGRVDQPADGRTKKRGRPVSSEVPPETAETTSTLETIDGIEYLVDTKTHDIYKPTQPITPDGEVNMENLQLVGKKLPNGQLTWYSDSDLMFMRSTEAEIPKETED